MRDNWYTNFSKIYDLTSIHISLIGAKEKSRKNGMNILSHLLTTKQ